MEYEYSYVYLKVDLRLKRIQLLSLIALALLTACSSSSGLSQKELEDLLGQARVDAAAKQFADAETKLQKCLQHADKNRQLFITLSALNQLVDVETELHNDGKAKGYIKEAGSTAETLLNCNPAIFSTADLRLSKEAMKAMTRLADDFAELGRYEAARQLYLGAQKLERTDLAVPPEDSAEARLQKLDERIKAEKHAIEREDGLSDKTDPKYHARIERTMARRALMEEMKALTNEMRTNPKTETVDKMFPLLNKIRTAFGERESEYRAALDVLIMYASVYGRREQALALLNEDIALYDNIDLKKVMAADPATLENADFLISDLANYSKMMMQIDNYEETRKAALRGIKLADDIRHVDSTELSELLKAAAWEREHRQRLEEAIPLRERQLAMLKGLNLTDNYPTYYESRLELGHSLMLTGRAKEALPHIDYAIERLKVNQPKGVILAYAYTNKAECLRILGELDAARKCMADAQAIWLTKGNAEQIFGGYRVFSKVAREMKRYDEAHEMGLKALKYCLQMPPQRKLVELPDTYLELALVEMERNHTKEAETYGRKALEAHLKAVGKPDFGAAGKLNFIALIATKQGKLAEAEKLRLRAVQYCQNSIEKPRTPLLSTMLQLANFYENTKQPEKAEKAFRDVLSTAKNLHGGEEMKDQYAINYLRMCRIQLAQLLRERKPQEANSLKEESIATRASLLTADPNQDCNFLISLGDLCLNLRDYENAEKVLREAENVANSTKPPLKDWVTVVSTRKRALYKAAK